MEQIKELEAKLGEPTIRLNEASTESLGIEERFG